jgi:hypothetical protein
MLWGSRGVRFRGATTGHQLLLGYVERALWHAVPVGVQELHKCLAPTFHKPEAIPKVDVDLIYAN